MDIAAFGSGARHGQAPGEPAAVDVIAQQITVESPAGFAMALSGRTVERHRAEIRARFGFREASIADADGLESWLRDQATATGTDPDALVARLEPPNLIALKAAVTATWPMTSLLDMIKEADLRLDFTEALKSPTTYEVLDRSALQRRLLLCLHGLGTNAGLQRMAGFQSGLTVKDLAYVRRRYLTADGLRRAIAIIANGTLHARNPAVWGDGTTACASDSKHFGAWDHNLTTQWHIRYGGRGIMIYWHVERKSLCIHSQCVIRRMAGTDSD